MKLSNLAILALKGSDQRIKDRIAEATGVATSTVYRWISVNSQYLTLAACLKILREELGLPDSHLLDEVENETVKQTETHA